MESWNSQELYSPAMHYSKHLEAASPNGPRPKLTFVAASFSKSDGVGTLLWRPLCQMAEGLVLMAIPMLTQMQLHPQLHLI